MTDLFITVLNMSIMASYVAVFVFFARWVLKKLKLPAYFAYLLWAIVFIRFITPQSFESQVSMVPVKASIIPHQITAATTPGIDSGIVSIDQAVNGAIAASVPAARPESSINAIEVILYLAGSLWLAGIAILAGYAVVSYIRLYLKLLTATKVEGNIFESDRISAPFVMGVIKPRIYLPLGLSAEQFYYIVKHEQTHIRRLDYLIKPAAFFVTALHWFNPIAWLSYRMMIKDMEMSCDESVMKQAEGDARAAYSYTLLSLATKQGGFPGPLSFGESDVKARVRNIMSYKKPVFWIGCIMAAILIIFAAGMLSNPLEAKEPEGQDEQLWKQRTEYVGNGGKVSNISGSLSYPEPFKYDHIELQTKNQPYRLTVFIAMNETAGGKQPASAEQLAQAAPDFNKNALLLFGLIGNVDEIVFQLKDEPKISSALYTREWAQARVKTPLFESTDKKEGFLTLEKTADELAAADQVTQTVEGFGQNLKNVRIAVVPKETTEELIDQYYTPYVTKELIAKWKQQIELTPGRELSSPWPERAEVQSVALAADGTYEVQGKVIWMAAGENVGEDAVTIKLKLEDGKWKISAYEVKQGG
ncbi:M56 family metallopeptidase [Paenibacillus sp. GCM10027626]|uniref:M56 family metallopeptidase n=1 Tax=Paenibacillus sp. GCM10027626 TaxID=3273411 RepID=UPI0036432EFA